MQTLKHYLQSSVLTLALSIISTVPQTNPCLTYHPTEGFYFTDNSVTVPTIPANQTIYVATTGNDVTNDGLTPGTPKLTLDGASGAWSLITNLTTNWLIEIAAGTYTGAGATNAFTIPTKNMTSTGGLYHRGTGTVVLAGVAGATSILYFGTAAVSRWYFQNITIGNTTSLTTSGAIRYAASTNCNRLVFDTCIINGVGSANLTGVALFYDSPVSNIWRSSTYVGDHIYLNCAFSCGTTGRCWSQAGTGINPLVGIRLYNCTSAGSKWTTRMLASNGWVEDCDFSCSGVDGGNMGFMLGANTTSGVAPNGNNSITHWYFKNSTFNSDSGHAFVASDSADFILIDDCDFTCGAGAATANIQGFVGKNARRINIINSRASGNTSASGTGNTAGFYFKGCTDWVLDTCEGTATSNGLAFQAGSDTVSSSRGLVRNCTFLAQTAANAKVFAVDYGCFGIIMDNNTYRYITGATLATSVGIRGVVPTNKATTLAIWQTDPDVDARANDVNSTYLVA